MEIKYNKKTKGRATDEKIYKLIKDSYPYKELTDLMSFYIDNILFQISLEEKKNNINFSEIEKLSLPIEGEQTSINEVIIKGLKTSVEVKKDNFIRTNEEGKKTPKVSFKSRTIQEIMDKYDLSRPTIENRLVKTKILVEETEKFKQGKVWKKKYKINEKVYLALTMYFSIQRYMSKKLIGFNEIIQIFREFEDKGNIS